jgi:uncharacterized protein YdaU (DUF1376 family)
MRTFLLTLSEESDPRNHRHQVIAGPSNDYAALRADFHAKNSDPEFSIISFWDSTGGVIRRKRLTREVVQTAPLFKKSKSAAAEPVSA